MTRNLASEFAGRGIRVNQVTPGGTKTPIWSPEAPTDQATSALEQRLAGITALGRMGEAEEIAKAALYLASDEETAKYFNRLPLCCSEIIERRQVTCAPSD
jgi:NAD(P)-dependent dehydrogenase (short-subunit alcohol dehydrogenase family)